MSKVATTTTLVCSALIGAAGSLWFGSVVAQEVEPPTPIRTPAEARTHGLEDLRTATANVGGVPLPDLSTYLKPGADRKLEQLGKLLYWDQGVGSEGMACASCHYHAGVDNRSSSQVSPGLMRVFNDRDGNWPDVRGYQDATAAPDTSFDTKPPGVRVRPADFPLIRNIEDSDGDDALVEANGLITMGPGNSNDAISSIGVTHKSFDRVRNQEGSDACSPLTDPIFHDGLRNTRRVPPRNSPTTINAVFNAFNFWDGRANHYFNGVNPFGVQDPAARVFVNNGGTLGTVRIQLPNSSLASQAVGPPNSDFEMACGDVGAGNARTWFEVGKKLLRRDRNGNSLRALGSQLVHPEDSLIGEFSLAPKRGSSAVYRDLIKDTFQEQWWRLPGGRVVIAGVDIDERPAAQTPEFTYPTPQFSPATPEELADEDFTEEQIAGIEDPALSSIDETGAPPPRFSLMEANFSMFFGLAVQAYEATLVADDSPFDRWMRTGSAEGFGNREMEGLDVYVNEGKCINCHGGPELTNASVRNFQQGNNLIEPMVMGDKQTAIYDNGFYNIGASPTTDDLGRGGKGPLDLPLSSSRQLLFEQVLGQNIPFKIVGDNGVPAVAAPDEGGDTVCVDMNGNGRCENDVVGEELLPAFQRVAVDGAFKTPGLRNIELQGPYFHHGAHSTLAQAVEFYDNGGNFCRFNLPDLDPDIQPLGLSTGQKRNLVRFMVALTDERVRYRQAPFDHPQLIIPANGRENPFIELPAVGASGSSEPLASFLGLNPQAIGNMPVDVRCSNGVPDEAG